jgi:predicted metalloprotease
MNHFTATRSASKTRLNVLRAAVSGLALLAVAAIGTGCAPVTSDDQFNARPASSSSPQPSAGQPSQAPETEAPSTEPSEDADSESPSTEPSEDADSEAPISDEEIDQLISDIEAATEVTDDYWQTHWSEYFTGSYTAPEVLGLYDGDDADVPDCAGEPLLDNNAHYCSDGHFVAWDDDLMLRALELGNSWVYFVVAHEWGHAIQAELDPSLHWNSRELQADCLAGASLYGAAEDGTLTLPDDFTSQMVDNLDHVADQTPWTGDADHGDAFERIDAFNDGRIGGVTACLPQE